MMGMTTSAVAGWGMMIFSVIAVVALVLLLCVKELAGASSGNSQRVLARFLDSGVVPLSIAFAVIVVMKVGDILAWF
jgi:hypothetical protein